MTASWAGRLLQAEAGFDLAGRVGGFAFVDGAGLDEVEVIMEIAFAVKKNLTVSRSARLSDLLEDAGLLFGVALTVHCRLWGGVWQKFLPAGSGGVRADRASRLQRRGETTASRDARPTGVGGRAA